MAIMIDLESGRSSHAGSGGGHGLEIGRRVVVVEEVLLVVVAAHVYKMVERLEAALRGAWAVGMRSRLRLRLRLRLRSTKVAHGISDEPRAAGREGMLAREELRNGPCHVIRWRLD